jgi:hypothetical protein
MATPMASLGRRSRPAASPSGQCLNERRRPSSTRAIGPASPEPKASRRYGWTLRTSSAEWTVPATTTTTPRATGRRGHRDGVGEVLRAVGQARGRRPHRRREDDRLGRREHALQEVRGLLERVGAVGDDDRRDLGPREVAGDAPGKRAPGGEVHVLAVELRDLLALDGDAGRDGSEATSVATGSVAAR